MCLFYSICAKCNNCCYISMTFCLKCLVYASRWQHWNGPTKQAQ